jgi:hypothetical protein
MRLVLVLCLLTVPLIADAKEHPFGEAGSSKRAQAQATANKVIRDSHLYAYLWARKNAVPLFDRAPVSIVLCLTPQEVARRTGCPATGPNGGTVLARADLKTRTIYICTPDKEVLYHECYHIWFNSTNEPNAIAFADWCMEQDEALDQLRFGRKLPNPKEK